MKTYLEHRRRQLAANVRNERQKRQMSQEQLARMIGSSRARVASIEAGRGGYSFEELEVIAQSMSIDIMDLTLLGKAEMKMLTELVEKNQGSTRKNTGPRIPWLAGRTSESVRNYIGHVISPLLPFLDGKLAYSIVHPNNSLAKDVIETFEHTDEILKVLDLEAKHPVTLRAFLAFLLGHEYRENASKDELTLLQRSSSNKQMVIIDHAENISEELLEWILNETIFNYDSELDEILLKRKDSGKPGNNYWLIGRDEIKFREVIYKVTRNPLDYIHYNVVWIPLW